MTDILMIFLLFLEMLVLLLLLLHCVAIGTGLELNVGYYIRG